MQEVFGGLGKETFYLVLSDMPRWYEFLFQETPAVLNKTISIDQVESGSAFDPDLIVLIDVNSESQLPGLEGYLNNSVKPILVIDHHVTNDGLGTLELIDTTASATGLIVFDLFNFAQFSITPSIAQALFVAVSTDTGFFQFANTDARTLDAASKLTRLGAAPDKMYKRMYNNFTPERFKLLTLALDSVKLYFDGKLAIQQLRSSDFAIAGASISDTENFIDYCRKISTVQAVAMLVELPNGKVKCSLRGSDLIDVSKIAQKFGGGGHKAAAGTHIDDNIDNATKSIIAEFEELFVPAG
jgi:phosphoesterase RecJ-like protein